MLDRGPADKVADVDQPVPVFDGKTQVHWTRTVSNRLLI
jgi:hypothetical protein